jgi:hypothetical protein
MDGWGSSTYLPYEKTMDETTTTTKVEFYQKEKKNISASLIGQLIRVKSSLY